MRCGGVGFPSLWFKVFEGCRGIDFRRFIRASGYFALQLCLGTDLESRTYTVLPGVGFRVTTLNPVQSSGHYTLKHEDFPVQVLKPIIALSRAHP